LPGRHVAPRHRAPRSLPRSVVRVTGDLISAIPGTSVTGAVALVGATGVAVGVGALTVQPEDAQQTAADVTKTPETFTASVPERSVDTTQQISRSASRVSMLAEQKADKNKHLSVSLQRLKSGVTEEVEATDPRDIAMGMLPDFGWSSDQFSCLDSLYMHESGWNPAAHNSSSGAHGIPQALPGDKMAVYGADWYTNPETQIEWGLHYIQDRYGSPCGAWGFWTSNNWY